MKESVEEHVDFTYYSDHTFGFFIRHKWRCPRTKPLEENKLVPAVLR